MASANNNNNHGRWCVVFVPSRRIWMCVCPSGGEKCMASMMVIAREHDEATAEFIAFDKQPKAAVGIDSIHNRFGAKMHSRTTRTAWISINQHELNLHTECTLHTWLVVTGPKILYMSETFTRLACIFNALYAVAHNQLVYFLFARFANQSVICYFANAKFQNWNDDQFLLFHCEIESVEVWLRCTSCLLPWCMCRICCCCCC